MTDIKVCPITCPHLVQLGVDLPVGTQRHAPHRGLHHGHFAFQMHLARELMHSYQLLDDPRPPSMKAADTTTFVQVCMQGLQPHEGPNLYLIHTLATIRSEVEYNFMFL